MRATVQPSGTFRVALAFALAALASCGGTDPGGNNPGPGGNGVVQFDGDSGAGNPPAYKDHPDMAVAANGSQVVETSGQNVNVYNYSGSLQTSTPTSSFIVNAVGSVGKVNDPRIVYDPFISRWLFVCSCAANYLIVSAGTDATGTWKGVALSGDSGDLAMRVGFDKNGVYVVQTDIVTITSKLFALPNNDVAWTSGNTISLAHEGIASGKTLDEMPAIDLDQSKPATAPGYFVSRSSPGAGGPNIPINLVVDSVTWSGSVASFASSAIIVPTGFFFNAPNSAQQPASPAILGTENHRIFSAYAFGGSHLYLVVPSGPCASNCGAQGTDSHDLFFLLDVNTPSLTFNQGIKIASAQDDWIFPSLAVDSQGNVAVAATGVSASEAAAVYEWHRLVTDSGSTIHGPNLLRSGSATYSCARSPVGWGTYSTTAQDGGDGTRLWTVQEYANSSTPCQWGTRLVGFKVSALP
ncbi:MAG TPA: hypothetical protein VJS37_06720 [Terriglobales bacterium]|nr:hypothetical protein [Terriglobales bacterium]